MKKPPLSPNWLSFFRDILRFSLGLFRSRTALVAENLFLRKQLAFYQERRQKPHPSDDATRFAMASLARLFDWRSALVVVRPETLIGWQRRGVRLYWRWKSRRGRPKLTPEMRDFIRRASCENPTWGEERLRDELRVKFGVRVSARTVRKYMLRHDPRRNRPGSQTWSSFIRNHADVIVAADFLAVFTARFQLLYVLVVMEVESRRLLHVNVTPHPSHPWTLQQFREALPFEHPERFVVLDRDVLFSGRVADSIERLGVRILARPLELPRPTRSANDSSERYAASASTS